jgi:predicted N-acetyltransferase YhbS
MYITNVTESMTEQITHLVFEAFQTSEHGYDGEAELTSQLRDSKTPTYEWVMIMNDTIVGHALLSEATVGSEVGLVLAPLSVAPDYQKQGIGTALIKQIESFAEENDYPFISILGNPDYYGRFDYVPANKYNVLAPFDVSEKYFMLKLINKQKAFNVTGTLSYAQAFGI